MPKLIEAYIHSNSKIGVLLELEFLNEQNRQEEALRQLASDIALQIAAANPERVEPARSADVVSIQTREATKGEIDEGALLTQRFVKKPDITVGQLIEKVNEALQEDIEVIRFERYD